MCCILHASSFWHQTLTVACSSDVPYRYYHVRARSVSRLFGAVTFGARAHSADRIILYLILLWTALHGLSWHEWIINSSSKVVGSEVVWSIHTRSEIDKKNNVIENMFYCNRFKRSTFLFVLWTIKYYYTNNN